MNVIGCAVMLRWGKAGRNDGSMLQRAAAKTLRAMRPAMGAEVEVETVTVELSWKELMAESTMPEEDVDVDSSSGLVAACEQVVKEADARRRV